jgi:serine/threonine protein kinase
MDDALAAGSRVGRYEIVRRLAIGGMAEIYLARMTGLAGFAKHVVVKRILPSFAKDAEFVRMFLNEARYAATLDHPNISHVYDFGQEGGLYYYAMEYLHGDDCRALLRELAQQRRKLPLAHALTIVVGAATGCHFAHELVGDDGKPLGLVHRDVSPSNVVVTYAGAIKLVDFGIAKATQREDATAAGVTKGKLAYMAPEQCRAEPLDRRVDVYALGVLLYELTTQRRAFVGENDAAIIWAVMSGNVTWPTQLDPDYPPALEAIIKKAMNFDRGARYLTARELSEAVEGFARDAGHTLAPTRLAEFFTEIMGARPEPWRDPDGRAATATPSATPLASTVATDVPTSVLPVPAPGRAAPAPAPTAPTDARRRAAVARAVAGGRRDRGDRRRRGRDRHQPQPRHRRRAAGRGGHRARHRGRRAPRRRRRRAGRARRRRRDRDRGRAGRRRRAARRHGRTAAAPAPPGAGRRRSAVGGVRQAPGRRRGVPRAPQGRRRHRRPAHAALRDRRRRRADAGRPRARRGRGRAAGRVHHRGRPLDALPAAGRRDHVPHQPAGQPATGAPMIRPSVILSLLIACAALAASARADRGVTALGRVRAVGSGPSVSAALASGYGFTGDVLAADDSHHRASGALALAVRAVPWLELTGQLAGRYDRHTGGVTDDGFIGDPRLGVTAGGALDDATAVGLRVGVWLPGADAPSIELAATTVDASLVVTRRFGASALTATAGYRLDRSTESVDAARLTPADRLGLGLSDADAALVGLGLTHRRGATALFGELSGEVLGRRRARRPRSRARCASAPACATPSTPRCALEALAEVGLSQRPDLMALPPDRLIDVEPRLAIAIGLSWRPAPARAPVVAPPPPPVDPTPPPPPPPPAPTTGPLTGTRRRRRGLAAARHHDHRRHRHGHDRRGRHVHRGRAARGRGHRGRRARRLPAVHRHRHDRRRPRRPVCRSPWCASSRSRRSAASCATSAARASRPR